MALASLAAGATAQTVLADAQLERSPAQSGPAADIAQLRSQNCPSFRALFEREYGRGQVQAARSGMFTIYRGLKARLIPPIDWTKNPHSRRGFRASLQTLKFLEVLFQEYADGSLAALRQAKELALDWLRANPTPAASQSSLAWFNKTVGERAAYLAYVVRAAACERMLSADQTQLLVGAIRAHGAWLADPTNYYPSNHGLFMDVGLLLISDHYFPFIDGAQAWELTARHRFPRTLSARVSPEGAWEEHSFGYHFLVMDLARRFLELGGGNARIRNLLARLTRAGAWFVQPDGLLAQIGDTDLDAAPQAVRRRSSRLSGMRSMPKAGLAFVRRGGSYLAVTANFHNASHKQADEGSFELSEHGVRLVSGPGKYGFDRDRRRRYVVSARSHSVLTVDGRSFPRDPASAYGSAVVEARRRGGWHVIVVRNPLLRRRGVEHRRILLYKPGERLVISDHVDAARPHRYRRHLQLGPDIKIADRSAAGLSLRGHGFHGCVTDARYAGGERAARNLVRGRQRPYQGWTFPQVAEAVPRWSVSYASRGEDVAHTLVVDLERECGMPDSEPVAEVVEQVNALVADLFGLFSEPPPAPPPPAAQPASGE